MLDSRNDLPRTLLAILFIGLLLVGSFLVLQPFLPAIVWASMLVVASWPLLLRLQMRLRGSRAAATAVMTVSLLLLLFVPLTLAIVTLITHTQQLVEMAKGIQTFLFSPPPSWVAKIPLVGDSLVRFWSEYAAVGLQGVAVKLAPYADDLSRWFVARMGSVGLLLLQFLLTVLIAALMFANGEMAATAVRSFARRLGGEQGERIVLLSSQAIRGVALGVGATALIQSVLGGIGLAICGVPFASLLTALMFMLCIAQIGPTPILALAVGWLFWSGDTAWAIVLLVIALIVGSIDNFIRPVLIRRGADLPLLLIFSGVIGGLMAFGLVGIFLGPLLLAISYTLLGVWIAQEAQAPAPGTGEAVPPEQLVPPGLASPTGDAPPPP